MSNRGNETSISRRERKKQETREFIVDAAWKIFQANGYEETSMDEISELADVSRSTLYNYFANGKEELFFTASIKQEKNLRELIEKEIPGNFNGLEELLYRYQKTVQFMLEIPLLVEGQRKFIVENATNQQLDSPQEITNTKNQEEFEANSKSDYLREFLPDLLDLENAWVQVFERGISDGSIRSDITPRQMTVMLWTIMTGLCDQLIIRKSMFPQYDLAQDIITNHTEKMIQSLYSP